MISSVPGTLAQLRSDIGLALHYAPTNEVVDKIVVCITTPGGEVYEAMAVYDYLRLLSAKYEINTVALGICASAGTIILQAGDVRYATNNTYLMTHKVLLYLPSGTPMTGSDAVSIQKDLNKTNNYILNVFSKRMHKPKKVLMKYFTDKFYNMYGGFEALKIGLVDVVIYDSMWRYKK